MSLKKCGARLYNNNITTISQRYDSSTLLVEEYISGRIISLWYRFFLFQKDGVFQKRSSEQHHFFFAVFEFFKNKKRTRRRLSLLFFLLFASRRAVLLLKKGSETHRLLLKEEASWTTNICLLLLEQHLFFQEEAKRKAVWCRSKKWWRIEEFNGVLPFKEMVPFKEDTGVFLLEPRLYSFWRTALLEPQKKNRFFFFLKHTYITTIWQRYDNEQRWRIISLWYCCYIVVSIFFAASFEEPFFWAAALWNKKNLYNNGWRRCSLLYRCYIV